jgi:F-type H+-transporting ATPase subunit b
MMTSRLNKRLVFVLFALLFVSAFGVAQQTEERPATPNKSAEAANTSEVGNANEGVAEILSDTTEKAAHSAEGWGRRVGLSPGVSFGISIGLNFAGIAAFIWVLLKSRLPQAFRERTAAIQKGIKEAQAASADANRRLSDIESRLSRLDAEVADIRNSAEREAAAEEERIRAAAEQDKQKIIEGAEAEIQAIARNARRELKGYAASLAVDLAGRRINVDEKTDRALVSQFVGNLGKDGQ